MSCVAFCRRTLWTCRSSMPTAWCSTTPNRATTSSFRFRTLPLASRRLRPTLRWMPRAGLFVAMPMQMLPTIRPVQSSPVLPTPSPIRLSLCIPRQWACAWASVRFRCVTRIATRQSPRRSMPRQKTVPPRRVCPWTSPAMMRSRMARRWPMQTWLLSSLPAIPWPWVRPSTPPASG